ncbi:MAG: alpha/beta hydrolase [Alphaproteobacteria bacterium]|nr:alpha/beta hydrolase [Alphaproteobacteria bacterium]
MNAAAPEAGYRARTFTVGDGTQLYFRDYGDRLSTKTAVFCLSGLTRNSKDFHRLALRMAAERRVVALDYRGRGQSDYDQNPQNYQPETYVRDVLDLAAVTGVHRAIVIGTSLGGLVAMGLAVARPTLLAGVVMNDIGPEIPAAAIARIGSYAGKDESYGSWAEAVAECKTRYGLAHPGKSDADWDDLTHDSFVEKAGRIVPDYDIRIAKARPNGPPPDLWALFGALANVPVLAIRGDLSDVLTAATFAKMADVKPDLIRVTVPNCGHNPVLDEPEVRAALAPFVARIDGQETAHG